MLTEEDRRRHVIGFEGQTMAFAGQYGLDAGRAHAQCVIDGAANALVRMDGAKDAATFLYGVADRVVANMREPTALPSALLPPPRPPDEGTELVVQATGTLKPRPQAKWRPALIAVGLVGLYLVGFLVGFLVGAVLSR